MAIATATINVYPYPKGADNTQRRLTLSGTIAISTGGTYPPGGFPLSWGGLEGLKSIPIGAQTQAVAGAQTLPFPIDVNVKSVANPPSGYIYLWDNVLGNLHIFETVNGAGGSNASGPLLEIGGAISNAIVTDVIQFTAEFYRI
jgi:hypothetical protein